MKNITLYRYIRADGGVTVSPHKPDAAYTEMLRLVAEDGMMLTKDGVNFVPCADVENPDGWYEVAATEEAYA